ncbi:hypothetical protein HELRODRAFT_178915 [Helobdella robusta]|uniref:Uncharacterized protein n=1 Tax=Helobdella robusta TaxID=6412 RepID=T1FDW2_HELRO|nr:hypothetical protein HELRODRAFT_178915 [Helobdella robusta]ESN95994.1 hypothetical protein HELRODRAFT_178915 [Helobdella robusta]
MKKTRFCLYAGLIWVQQHEQNGVVYPDDGQAQGSRPVFDRVQGISFHVTNNNNTNEATLLKKKMLDEFKAMLPHTDHQHEKHNGYLSLRSIITEAMFFIVTAIIVII